MSYTKAPLRYNLPSETFTGGDGTQIINGPKGKGGRLHDFGIRSTTLFAGDTTKPKMAVGISGTLEAYGKKFDFGALAAGDMKSVRSTHRVESAGFEAIIPAATNFIPADTPIYVTLYDATGGSAAGVGAPFVDIIWDD